MQALPALLLLTGAAILGTLLGLNYLRGVRSKPVMIGFHLLLGGGGLEVMAMLLHGTPDRQIVPGGGLMTAAAACVLAAMFTGLLAPLIGRQSRPIMNTALIVHVTVAITGFTLLLAFVAQQ